MKKIHFFVISVFIFSYLNLVSAVWVKTGDLPTGVVEKIRINPINGHIYAIIYGQGIFQSTDEGISWSEISNGLPNKLVKDILVAKDGRLFCGLNGSGIFVSTVPNIFWVDANTNVTNKNILALETDPAGNLYACSWFYGELGLSTDQGNTWTNIGPGKYDMHAVCITKDKTLLVGSEYNGLHRKAQSDSKWSLTGFSSYNVYSITKSTGSDIWVGASNGVSCSSDDGKTWNSYNTGLPVQIARSVVPTNNGYVFIATPMGVFKLKNKTGSWTEWNNGILSDDKSSYCLAIDSKQYLYTGRADGVYKTTLPANSSELAISVTPDNEKLLDWNESCEFLVTVNDDSGNPLNNVKVLISDSLNGSVIEKTTDSKGQCSYILKVPVDKENRKYTVKFTASVNNYFDTETSRTVTVNHTISVEGGGEPSMISIYPQPARDWVIVNFNNIIPEQQIFLINILGIKTELKAYSLVEDNLIRIDLSVYPRGIYYLIIDDKSYKFIKD